MELTITDLSSKYKSIKLSGKIDWENARTLDREIQQIIDGGCVNIVFNLDEVTFMCSGGIGALVYNLNKVRKMGGAIYIISSNEYINYIFETLKFDIVFERYLFKSFDTFREKVIEKKESRT